MLKRITVLAVLATLTLCCLPVSASTISSDDMIAIALGFDAREIGVNKYSIPAGGTALLGLKAAPGDYVWCFAVGQDQGGNPDYSSLLTLIFDKAPDPAVMFAAFEVPAELAGHLFYVQAIAASQAGTLKSSPILTVAIPGRQVLFPPPPHAVTTEPVLAR